MEWNTREIVGMVLVVAGALAWAIGGFLVCLPDKPAGKQIVVDGEGFESVDNHFFGLADLTKEQ